jgi:hypothetical protein
MDCNCGLLQLERTADGSSHRNSTSSQELAIEQRYLSVAVDVTYSYMSQLLAKKKRPRPKPDGHLQQVGRRFEATE